MGNCFNKCLPSNKKCPCDPHHTIELTNNSFNDLKKFTFNGLITKCKVVDVYDGDTVTIVFYFNGQPIKDTFRMYGYDSPEIRPLRTLPNRDLHIKAGIYVKEYLINHLLNKIIWVKFNKEEKYGRLMGELYYINPDNENQFTGQEININKMMTEKGYGKPYYGESKAGFTDNELMTILKYKDDFKNIQTVYLN